MMKTRLRKGATLLITTVALSVVTVTAAAFSTIYFRYQTMNTSYIKADQEKVDLRNKANIAYEHFLKDTSVEYNGTSQPLRTGWLLSEPGLGYQATISFTLSNFIASFRMESQDKSLLALFIEGDTYVIQTKIKAEKGVFNLNFSNFDRKAS